ncbi:MAG: hypothetical protein Q8O76_14220 [Chloroflexota bacterium]|nr:hypothetical protein [Chloroflexota bacterium]
MKRRMVLAAVVVALAFQAATLPVAAAEPHVNPDTAPLVFDGVSLVQKYSEGLDYVLGRDAAGVESLQEQAAWANIPADLRDTVSGFLSSSQSLARLIPGIEADLESSRTMLAQFRASEAQQSAAEAKEKLTQAYSELGLMERQARVTGRWWQVDLAGEGSALRKAYEEVEAKLLRLRYLLDLLSEMRGSLTEQSGTLEGLLLRPTALTLSVEPAAAFVGEPVEFRGRLTAEAKPLVGRKVTVLLAGSPVSEVLTDSAGFYRGQMVLPYQYVSETTVKAIYYPKGDDIGLYLGCSSPTVTVEVLYYEASLSLQVPGTAHPGRKLALQGSFDYGTDPVPEARDLRLYWDGELAAEETMTTAFALDVAVAAETPLGRHRVTVYVPPQRRYAPTWASADVEVVKATPIIELDAPRIVLLPMAQHIQGRVYSSLGPLEDASVQVILGDWEVGTRSRDDGTFGVRLSTGMSMTLVGTQQLQVIVTPTEPWNKDASSATGLLVVNPANIAGLVLAMAIPAVFGARWLRRRRVFPSAARPAPQVAPPLVRSESPPLVTEVTEPGATGSPRAILLALYRGVLRLVQAMTSVVPQSSHTLREFSRECAPRLGPLAGYFQEFTLIIERLLYSRHHPGEAEAARGEELSQRLREGVRGEDT